MKTILILTDFSESAAQAARAATLLIEKLRTNVILYHTYYDSPELLSYAGGPLLVDDLILRKADAIVNLGQVAIKLRFDIDHLSPGSFHPVIEQQCSEGPLGKNVSAILKEKDVEMIIMGNATGSGIHHLFFGSDTLSVVDDATRPVLIVPPKTDFSVIKKIILATAFELTDINAITYLIDLCKVLNYKLEIVHVNVYSETDDLLKKQAIRTFLVDKHIAYSEIRGKDVVNRLGALCEESQTDILALIHYNNGFFSNIFQKSNTAQLILNHATPLLVIPGKVAL